MANYTYTASVKLPNGSHQKIKVLAETSGNAKAMLETQYGKGNVSNVQKA
jgi:hypothetical protein